MAQPGPTVDAPSPVSPPLERAPVTRRRNPTLAATLSILPGLGQLYNLQLRKAITFFLLVLFTVPPSCFLIANSRRIAFDLIDSNRVAVYFLWVLASIVIFLVLFLLGLTFWASAVIDARRSAKELSEGLPPTRNWLKLKL